LGIRNFMSFFRKNVLKIFSQISTVLFAETQYSINFQKKIWKPVFRLWAIKYGWEGSRPKFFVCRNLFFRKFVQKCASQGPQKSTMFGLFSKIDVRNSRNWAKTCFLTFRFYRNTVLWQNKYTKVKPYNFASSPLITLQSGATFAEVKKILNVDLTFFSTFLTTVRDTLRISAYLFLQIGSFFWSFRKFAKKLILKRFSCIFPYREVIGEIEKISPLSATYMVKNMPSKCLKNAKFYFLCFLLKK